MALSNAQVLLVEIFTESILYGIYLVLFVVMCWVLFHRMHAIPTTQIVMFGIAILMFMISSAHIVLVLIQNLQTAVSLQNAQARVFLAQIHFFLGDFVLIWRVWVVWGRNKWVVLIPTIILFLTLGFAMELAGTVSQSHLQFFAIPAPALTTANTILCTGLVASRIWFVRYKIYKMTGISESSGNSYTGIMLLIIECGAVYAASQITSMILLTVGTDALHIVLDFQIPLAGIMPTLIILLVHLDKVPGTHVNQQYNDTIRTGFQAAIVTINSQTTPVTLKDHSDSGKDSSYQLGEWRQASVSQTSEFGAAIASRGDSQV